MNARRGTFIAAVLTVAACSQPAADGASGPYEPVADVQQLMASVLEPAAEVYWEAVGWIDDESGTTELRPTTDEEWEAVRGAAFTIAESGNLLLMPGRAVPEAAWTPMAQALIDAGRRALAAADARDELAVFNAGAEVYYVCTNCHAAYALETLRPADERIDPNSP